MQRAYKTHATSMQHGAQGRRPGPYPKRSKTILGLRGPQLQLLIAKHGYEDSCGVGLGIGTECIYGLLGLDW